MTRSELFGANTSPSLRIIEGQYVRSKAYGIAIFVVKCLDRLLLETLVDAPKLGEIEGSTKLGAGKLGERV